MKVEIVRDSDPKPHHNFYAAGKYNEGMFMFVRVMVNSLPALYLLSFFVVLMVSESVQASTSQH